MDRIISRMIVLSLAVVSCTNTKPEKSSFAEIEKLKVENDSLKSLLTETRNTMKKQMIRSLTFQNKKAENAMNFYIELFDNSKVINVQRWGKDDQLKKD